MAWFNPFLRPGNIKRNFHRSEIDFSRIKQVKINRNATETILLFYYFFLRLLALKTIKQNFTFIYHFHTNAFQLQKIIKQELYITCVSIEVKPVGSLGVFISNSSFIFLVELLYSFSRETKSFSDLAVSHIDKKGASLIWLWSSRKTKKSPPPAAILFGFATFATSR